MANRLQFKRGNGKPGAILRAGEPAYDITDGLLYVGLNTSTDDSNEGQLIGGRSYVERVDDIIRNGNGDIFVSGIATVGTLELGTDGQGVTASIILDEDDLASNRADAIPTQQSVKRYVDDFLTAGNGDLSITNLDASGYVQVGSGLTVNGGSAEINTDLDVNGTSNFSDAAQFQSNVDIDGTLDVQLAANFQSGITVGGETDLDGGLDVANNTNLQGDLTVGGASDLNGTLAVQGKLTAEDELQVLGSTDLDGNLDVAGSTNIQGLTVGGDIDANGNIDVQNNLTVNGTSTLEGDVDLNANLDISGNIDLTGNISVGGTIEFNGDLDLNANIDIENNLTVGGDIDANGSANIAEDLVVQRNLEVAGLSTFKDNAVFEKTVEIQGDLTVAGTATKVNFEVRDVAIEDRFLELGMVDGQVPTQNTSWDLGLGLNYQTGGTAKKAAVVWQDNTGFNLAAEVSESQTTGENDPQLTVGAFANLGINGLYLGNVTDSTKLTINSDKDASLNELFIGGEIDSAGNKFAAFNTTSNLVDITNASFDGGTY